MDQKQKADYLKSPYHCPHCNSGHIEAETFDGELSCQPVVCLACGKQWTNVSHSPTLITEESLRNKPEWN